MHSDIRLIALDVDGTLVTGNQPVSATNREAIRLAHDHRIHVTLATGRHRQEIVDTIAAPLGLEVPLVTLNGGEIWHADGRLLARHALSWEDARFIYDVTKDAGIHFWAFTDRGLVTDGRTPFDMEPDTGLSAEEQWLKFVLFTDTEETHLRLMRRLASHGGLTLTSSAHGNIEVNPRNVSNAHGLQQVCTVLRLSASQVAVIGDGYNDVEMIRWAGLGIAMGNAPDAVREIADRVTGRSDEDGVAQAILRIVQEG